MIKVIERYYSDRWQRMVIIYECTICKKSFDSITMALSDIKKHECKK